MVKHKIKIPSGKKEISATYYCNDKTDTLVIIAYGIGQKNTYRKFKMTDVALRPLHDNYDVIVFDYTSNYITERIFDIENLLKSATKNKKYKKIILSGSSLGSLITILTILKESYESKKITHLVTLNGFFKFDSYNNFFHVLEMKLLKFTTLFDPKLKMEKEFCIKNYCPKKIKIPTLVICSTKDKITGTQQSEGFFRDLKIDKKEIKYMNSGHYPSFKTTYKVSEIVTEWIKKN